MAINNPVTQFLLNLGLVLVIVVGAQRVNSGLTQPGKIVAISGVIDPATGAASAKAVFPNPNGMLHSGNTGQIMIPQIHNNVMMVPQAATYEMQDMKFVYVVGDSNKVHSTPITISEENDGKNYIVTGGLKPGQQIVVEGVGISVKDDMVIKPKK